MQTLGGMRCWPPPPRPWAFPRRSRLGRWVVCCALIWLLLWQSPSQAGNDSIEPHPELPTSGISESGNSESGISETGVAESETTTCLPWMLPGDELWVVSTRGLGCPNSCEDFRPQVQQYLGGGWTVRPLRDLVEAQPMHTVVYVHGNRFQHADAIRKGFRIHRLLAQGEVRPMMRFVIWSWPSERIHGPFRDVRLKAERADVEGYYLACLIAKKSDETAWSFLGHSFGARVIGGALEAMGSGELWGVRLERDTSEQPALARVALLAAAIDGDIFLPGRDFSNALAVVEQLLVLYNPTDPVLKRYALLDRFRRPRALGAVGMPWGRGSNEVGSEVRQQNVARIVGRSHDDERFYSSPSLMAEVRRVLLEYPVVESP